MKKFRIDEKEYKIEPDGTKVYRIIANYDICTKGGVVQEGEYGGYVESEKNLAQSRNCWVFGDSVIRDNARVCGESMVFDSVMTDNALTCDLCMVVSSQMSGNSVVSGRAIMLGSMALDNSIVSGATRAINSVFTKDSNIFEKEIFNSVVFENQKVSLDYQNHLEHKKYKLIPIKSGAYEGCYRVQAKRDIDNFQAKEPIKAGTLGGIVSGSHNLSRHGECWIDYDAVVTGGATVFDYAYVGEGCTVCGDAVVCGSASVANSVLFGNAFVAGRVELNNVTLADKSRLFGSVKLDNEQMTLYQPKDKNCQIKCANSYEVELLADSILLK